MELKDLIDLCVVAEATDFSTGRFLDVFSRKKVKVTKGIIVS